MPGDPTPGRETQSISVSPPPVGPVFGWVGFWGPRKELRVSDCYGLPWHH